MTRFIVTNSFRGGTGKSTIVSNLATYVAGLGKRVIVIDADIRSPGIHAIFGLDEGAFTTTFTDYLLGNAKISEAVYDISSQVGFQEQSLFLVPSSIAQSSIAEILSKKIDPKKLKKAIDALATEFEPDYILMDTHPGLNEEILLATNTADSVLTVIRPDNQDYQGAAVSAEIAKKLDATTYFVLNKLHRRMNKAKIVENMEGALGLRIAGGLPFSEKLQLSESQYIFLQKYPADAFSGEIQRIANTVLGIRPREDLRLARDVLMLVRNGTSEARTLHQKSALRGPAFKETVLSLVDQRLLSQDKNKFHVTEKGAEFLQRYGMITQFIKNFRL